MDENTHLRQELRERYDSNFVGSSGPMRRSSAGHAGGRDQHHRAGPRRIGNGQGADRARDYNSSLRAKKPFVKVSCAALPDSLIESELFGYERGRSPRRGAQEGRFELADGGTLFLTRSAKRTRCRSSCCACCSSEFERVGGTETVKANVRLIAATNKDLEKRSRAAPSGRTRYRLNVLAMFVPPLRSGRPTCCSSITSWKSSPANTGAASSGSQRRRSTCWPVITGPETSASRTPSSDRSDGDGQVIHGHHLPPSLQTAEASGTVTRVSLLDAVNTKEKDLLQDALKTTRGNCARAARLLDTTERIFNYKVRNYAIDTQRFKS